MDAEKLAVQDVWGEDEDKGTQYGHAVASSTHWDAFGKTGKTFQFTNTGTNTCKSHASNALTETVGCTKDNDADADAQGTKRAMYRLPKRSWR